MFISKSVRRIYNFALFALIVASLFSCNSTQSTTTTAKADEVVFQSKSFDKVLQLAKKENKPVFVDFYTSWCAPCKIFEKEVLTDKTIYTFLNDNFVNIKIDAEKGEGPALSQRYLVTQYPTIYFLDPSGQILEGRDGMPGGTELMNLAKSAMDQMTASID